MKEFDKINVFGGAIATFLTSLLGDYWFLFAGFLFLNMADYATGYTKSKYFLKNASSSAGAKGILKKVMYWIVIAVAFFMGGCFAELGEIFNMDLSFMYVLGYFTLATYIINEIRSIIENCVVMGIKVPDSLVSGLDIAEKLIKDKVDTKEE